MGLFKIKKKKPKDEMKAKIPEDPILALEEDLLEEIQEFELPPPKPQIPSSIKKSKIPTDHGTRDSKNEFNQKENVIPPQEHGSSDIESIPKSIGLIQQRVKQPNQKIPSDPIPRKTKVPTDYGLKDQESSIPKDNLLPPKRKANHESDLIPKSTGILKQRVKHPNQKLPPKSRNQPTRDERLPSRKGTAINSKKQTKNILPPTSRERRRTHIQEPPSRKGVTSGRKKPLKNQKMQEIKRYKVPDKSKTPPASAIMRKEERLTKSIKSKIPPHIKEKTPTTQKSNSRRIKEKIPKS